MSEEEEERVFFDFFFLMCAVIFFRVTLCFSLSLVCVFEISEIYKDPPFPYSQHALGENI